MTAPYRSGDRITVTHDTLAGQLNVVRLNDGITWRVETDRHGGGEMHLYVDRAGVCAVGEITAAKS